MNTQKRVPVPACCVLKRDGPGNHIHFQWESLNASNGAELPFRYHYVLDLENNEGKPSTPIHQETTSRTQTKPISVPSGHEVRLTLTTIDRTGFHSPTRAFYFNA